MAVDRHGSTIAPGEVYAIVGRVDNVVGDNVVVLTGLRNEHAIRCKAGDIVKVDALGPIFSVPAGSMAAPTLPEHYIRGTDLTASQAAQDAIFLAYLGSNYIPQANNVISNAFLRDSAALSVIGRSANSAGDPADIVAGVTGQVLRRLGTALGFGTIGGDSIDDGSLPAEKLQDVLGATSSLVGNLTAGGGMQQIDKDSLPSYGSPSTLDLVLLFDKSTGELKAESLADCLGAFGLP